MHCTMIWRCGSFYKRSQVESHFLHNFPSFFPFPYLFHITFIHSSIASSPEEGFQHNVVEMYGRLPIWRHLFSAPATFTFPFTFTFPLTFPFTFSMRCMAGSLFGGTMVPEPLSLSLSQLAPAARLCGSREMDNL